MNPRSRCSESTQLQAKLTELLALPAETEWVEFKEAKNNYDFDDFGEYFSALSNEANLKGQPWGWFVFGVRTSRSRSSARNIAPAGHLDSLKEEIANQTSNRLTFEEIYEVVRPEGRVLMFQIPPALRGCRPRGRDTTTAVKTKRSAPLNIHEIEQIRKQATREDWSAQIAAKRPRLTISTRGIAFARQEFKKKHPDLAAEVDVSGMTLTFLNKAKVCISGRITRTAIILLGKNEAEHFLSPGIARITWMLKDEDGIEKDYQHFGPPLILAVDQVFAKVRNLTYRYLPDASLFPTEITQYDPWVIRETLHNCIAHQDYSQGGQDQRRRELEIAAVHQRRRVPAGQRGGGHQSRRPARALPESRSWPRRWSI